MALHVPEAAPARIFAALGSDNRLGVAVAIAEGHRTADAIVAKGYTRRTVYQALQYLEREGLITRKRQTSPPEPTEWVLTKLAVDLVMLVMAYLRAKDAARRDLAAAVGVS